MKEVDMAMLVDGVAKIISGAPFPSKQSLSKARKAVEFVLAAPALDLPSLAERDQLRAEKKEFAQEATRWAEEAGRLKALLEDAQSNIEKLKTAMNYALAQHNRPYDFSPYANHWSCVVFNTLGDLRAAQAAEWEGQG